MVASPDTLTSSATPSFASPTASIPSTPRTRISYPISASNSSSLSSSRPFDWDAARQRRPPPYASPLQTARARVLRKGESGTKSSPRRVVRRKSWKERIISMPSDMMFELSLFPNNLPLPPPKTSAWLIGGFMHLVHFCVRVSKMHKASDDELNWEDLYNESRGANWFEWTTPITFMLIACAFFNALKLLTRVKVYNLHHRAEPVSSPHASFVPTQLDFDPLEHMPFYTRISFWFTYYFTALWHFLFALKPHVSRGTDGTRINRVQQLSVWVPGEFELRLFAVYSPVHALLWISLTSMNWILMFSIMAISGAQIHLLILNYEALSKDRAIISAEVMHEYDVKFVHPRINPVRKDAAVMTHQSEVVNIWDE